jgi:hypothetical protein
MAGPEKGRAARRPLHEALTRINAIGGHVAPAHRAAFVAATRRALRLYYGLKSPASGRQPERVLVSFIAAAYVRAGCTVSRGWDNEPSGFERLMEDVFAILLIDNWASVQSILREHEDARPEALPAFTTVKLRPTGPSPFVRRALVAYLRRFPDQEACIARLEAVRWPKGAACPKCGGIGNSVKLLRPAYWQCRACRAQFNVLNGTPMEGTHLPLRIWFGAIFLAVKCRRGVSAMLLSRQLGIGYKTAWSLSHRLHTLMAQDRKAARRLVEVNDQPSRRGHSVCV